MIVTLFASNFSVFKRNVLPLNIFKSSAQTLASYQIKKKIKKLLFVLLPIATQVEQSYYLCLKKPSALTQYCARIILSQLGMKQIPQLSI